MAGTNWEASWGQAAQRMPLLITSRPSPTGSSLSPPHSAPWQPAPTSGHHAHTAGLPDDDITCRNVPAVDAVLVVGISLAAGHQTHVDCRRASHPNTAEHKQHTACGWGVGVYTITYPCTGLGSLARSRMVSSLGLNRCSGRWLPSAVTTRAWVRSAGQQQLMSHSASCTWCEVGSGRN